MIRHPPQYFLARHAYMCIAHGYAVFLDVKKDKYTALSNGDARALAGAVAGWPLEHSDRSTPLEKTPQQDDEELLQELLQEELLTTRRTAGKHANPISLERATEDLRDVMDGPGRPTVDHALRFVSAWAVITLLLRTRSLEHVIDRVRLRKDWFGQHDSFDLERARALIASYCNLQPRFFSAHNACLRNSLTLVEYLARYRMYPAWVFGVHMDPFAAHSWVQHGSVVLNDTIENVREFVPILVI